MISYQISAESGQSFQGQDSQIRGRIEAKNHSQARRLAREWGKKNGVHAVTLWGYKAYRIEVK